jgi:hypothetical protein
MSATASAEQVAEDATAIRPFRVAYSEAELADLAGRISETRWPEEVSVATARWGAVSR